MAISEHEHRQMDAERAVIAARVCDFAESLPDRTDIAAARLEGEQICEILEPLGLPEALVAAVRLYPLCREGLIGSKELQKLKIEGMPELVQGLVQLGRFSLPPDWQPGEALAVQQSEALRKMLLAVVSDARLVVVRIAEELYRLRLAKRAPVAEQRALAIETQEIYAPLSNRRKSWERNSQRMISRLTSVAGPNTFSASGERCGKRTVALTNSSISGQFGFSSAISANVMQH
jgi:GTP pyrophosphokinase